MNNRRFVIAGGGCGFIGVFLAGLICAMILLPLNFITNMRGNLFQEEQEEAASTVQEPEPGAVSTQQAIPTLPAGRSDAMPTVSAESVQDMQLDQAIFPDNARLAQEGGTLLNQLYQELNPGVVNIQVYIERGLGGQGAGSGFLLDEQGHIVTNNHVVAGASQVTVVFYNGFEAEAEVVGTDDDSDLAVIRVDELPEAVRVLPLADSGEVQTGDWVIAIGNPFSLGGSMTLGIVSSVGRVIPSGVTPFAIPEAIQTDAAINPGNSGGPLLNLNGEVVGVNAQIRSDPGVRANAGVGFAIPSNVVRRVVPVLIEQGSYQWPWLGVRGTSVNLLIRERLNLDTQRGAFIAAVEQGGPAEEAGLQSEDVIVNVNGEPVDGWDELLTIIAFSEPGAELDLTLIRNGERVELTVPLRARPDNFDNFER